METFWRPKASAHAPASHVAWLIALTATPREGHSRSSLVGSWAGLLADAVDRPAVGWWLVKREKSGFKPTCN